MIYNYTYNVNLIQKSINYSCALTTTFKTLNTIPYINADMRNLNYVY